VLLRKWDAALLNIHIQHNLKQKHLQTNLNCLHAAPNPTKINCFREIHICACFTSILRITTWQVARKLRWNDACQAKLKHMYTFQSTSTTSTRCFDCDLSTTQMSDSQPPRISNTPPKASPVHKEFKSNSNKVKIITVHSQLSFLWPNENVPSWPPCASTQVTTNLAYPVESYWHVICWPFLKHICGFTDRSTKSKSRFWLPNAMKINSRFPGSWNKNSSGKRFPGISAVWNKFKHSQSHSG